MAVAQVLRHPRGKQVNIYTNSRYVLTTLHVHGAIYKERGLLTAGGKEIKNKKEILQLLEAVWNSSQVAVIHCKGHQRGTDPISKGNWLADEAAKEAATNQAPQWALSQSLSSSWPQLVKQHHETTHLGKAALESLLSCYYFIPKLPTPCAPPDQC